MHKIDDSLENYIDSLNDSISEIEKNNISSVRQADLPSNLKILLGGISDSGAINFLFSDKVDQLIEKLFDMVMSGNFEQILNSQDDIGKIFEKVGIGTGYFEGEISKTVIQTIQKTTSSMKFKKIKFLSRVRKI